MLEFNTYLEDENSRTFFVPDTGLPGGTGVLTAPDGTRVALEPVGFSTDVREWPGGVHAVGMAFSLPPLSQEGDYVFSVTQPAGDGQPDVVTTYLIHSKHDPERYDAGAA